MSRAPLLLFALLAAPFAASSAEEKISFNEHIRPIFADTCFACHGSDAAHRKAKLRLDTPAGAYAERNDTRAVVPGKLEDSELWHRITSTDPDEVMPSPDSHKPPLTPAQRDLIKRWIEQGAVYQKHWAYEPIARSEIPKIENPKSKIQNPIDAFILQKLASHKLTLSPEAAPEILLRRLTLDLTGLPPTIAEIEAFERAAIENRESAIENLVDRLLASPRYGEHFARTWLDAVRYADTHGMHLDNERTLWPYRDWVVRAYNENMPFDQFTLEQLAGDLLPRPTLSQLVATGYIRSIVSTSEGGSLEAEAEARNTADRTDTTAAVWLGLTANCASCHDHKFDPLTQRETYAFGAFFKGLADRVWDGNVPLPGPRVLLANAAQQPRIDAIATALPPLQSALGTSAAALAATGLGPVAKPSKNPITYEVVWAEDGDITTDQNFSAPPLVGDWRTGPDVPLVGGQRALRFEGPVTDRLVTFGAGEVDLILRTGLRAFAHFRADPAKPPRAVSLELVAEGKLKRAIWGDPAAFGPDAAKDALLVGPLPVPGAYFRLELDAVAAGLTGGKSYAGLRLSQSDGNAWWDRIGTVNTSPNASEDPLLAIDAWITPLRRGETDYALGRLPVLLDVKYLMSLYIRQQNEEEKQRRSNFYRDYIYGPSRGALEPEAFAARKLIAEQVHYELTIPGTLIARELPEPRPAHVLLRGQYDNLGELVAPATPAFLPPLTPANPARATRLDLARWLVDGKNPVPPRLAVNRIWQQVFGYGLVRTPADFGSQGDPPTHPALLDWLASEFIAAGWDTKKMVRLLVTSRTYRQDSRATPALLEFDPANKLLARGPRVRLDAEVLRDQALALGGLLVPSLGGPPVRPYQPINVWEPVAYPDSNTRFYTPDKGDALYRRSLYTFIKRNAPAPALTTFDAPSREAFCPVRGHTNTPLQALALMNDVQQFEAARAFAEKLLARDEPDPARLAYAFRAVTARVPTAAERTLLATALAKQRAHFTADPEAAKKILANGESKSTRDFPAPDFAAYTLVANLLLNLDETITRN
ncbi:MAG: PSD1 domain-containing protein [Undibacterium sp.]|nr:PSD1 domain-containing protein [Opitutaceae bacterium]